MLIPLLFFGLMLAGVVVLIRRLWPEEERRRSSSRALEVLDERYAKGEIEREEYLRRRRDILAR
jgi:putative membrane protein